jgi:hypothetical protein
MPLEITQRKMNGIYLLALKGRLVLGHESSGLIIHGPVLIRCENL